MTPSQQRAIDSNAPAILVVAGAGSGKTTVVTRRIARLVGSGVKPWNILVLTFTRKAANELRERLEVAIGQYAAGCIWAGTFHAICYKILSRHGDRIGYQITDGNHITVVTPAETEMLLAEIVDEYRWRGSAKDLAAAKQELAHTGEFPTDPDIGRIIREYWARLRECNAVDFDQLLLEVSRLFEDCPDVLEVYHDRFKHVFVDEYQDTDHLQYRLHEDIAPASLFVVGDPRQAIYGWRGADISIIKGFVAAHPGAEVIELLENFRSGAAIVAAANKVIANNEEGKHGLIPTIQNSKVEAINAPAGVGGVAAKIVSAGVNDNSIAVIARTHATLKAVEKNLIENDIRCHRVGAGRDGIESTPEWAPPHAALRCPVNPRDDVAFRIAHEWFGVRTNDLKGLKVRAIQAGKSMIEQHLVDDPEGELSMLRDIAQDPTATVFDVTKSYLAFDHPVVEKIDAKIADVFQHIEDLGGADMPCVEWLEWLSTKDMHADLEAAANDHLCVLLLTAHAAKGLEWDCVIIADFDEGIFPAKRTIREGHIEEERRLAYVAMTRARDHLVMFHSGKPSRFIGEAGITSTQTDMEVAF